MLQIESLEARRLFDSIGPDGFGYVASNFALEAVDLLPGDPGVITLHGTADDAALPIPLGAHTFNFYGQSYTGSNQLYVSTNGLITFGSGNDAYANTDFSAVPAQAAIAPHWDDLNVDSTNADSVVYQFDNANSRLIIEWNGMSLSGASGRATFQTILSLDTPGPSPIIFNYPDLDVGNSLFNDGGRATIGIKAAGSQGANRLVVSFNSNTGGMVATGSAVRIAVDADTTAPKVTSGQFAFDAQPQKLVVQFDEDLNGTLTSNDVTLFNLTSGQPVANADLLLSYDALSKSASITFPTLLNAALPDGNYTLTIASAGVSDAAGNALDGDANGIPGGDYHLDFFFLNADANRDRIVDTQDFNILAANFGGSSKVFSQGNFNYDVSGNVNSVDFNLFAGHYGTRLASASPTPGPALFSKSGGFSPDRIEI